MRALGVQVTDIEPLPRHPDLALYHSLRQRYSGDAHARYNTLIRCLVSFERELERRRFSSARA